MDDRRVTFSNRQLTDMIVPLFFEQLLVMFVGIVRRVYIFIHKNVRRHHVRGFGIPITLCVVSCRGGNSLI